MSQYDANLKLTSETRERLADARDAHVAAETYDDIINVLLDASNIPEERTYTPSDVANRLEQMARELREQ